MLQMPVRSDGQPGSESKQPPLRQPVSSPSLVCSRFTSACIQRLACLGVAASALPRVFSAQDMERLAGPSRASLRGVPLDGRRHMFRCPCRVAALPVTNTAGEAAGSAAASQNTSAAADTLTLTSGAQAHTAARLHPAAAPAAALLVRAGHSRPGPAAGRASLHGRPARGPAFPRGRPSRGAPAGTGRPGEAPRDRGSSDAPAGRRRRR